MQNMKLFLFQFKVEASEEPNFNYKLTFYLFFWSLLLVAKR